MTAKTRGLAALQIGFQGDLARVRVIDGGGSAPKRGDQATRGDVTNFSRKSRRRLMEYLATLKVPEKGMTFVTLTYAREYPCARLAKVHLDTWLKRVKRKFPDAAGFWRLEFQKRGAPHFHLLFINMPYWDKDELMESWASVIGLEAVFTRIEHVRSKRGCYSYMSKYVAKVDDDVDLSTVHTSPQPIGRVWGVHNRAGLEFHEGEAVTLWADPKTIMRAYFDIRRMMSQDVPHLNDPDAYLSMSWFAHSDKRTLDALVQYLEFLGVYGWQERRSEVAGAQWRQRVGRIGLAGV